MNLTYPAARLVKFFLSFTGEKVVNEKGEEVDSQRKMSGEESAQRRHFAKAFEPKEVEVNEKIKQLQESHNLLVEKEKAALSADLPEEEKVAILNKDPELVASVKNLQAELIKLLNEKHDIEVTEETKKVIKKYFEDFSNKIGFLEGDDQLVEELIAELK
jgi:hypothetical protein